VNIKGVSISYTTPAISRSENYLQSRNEVGISLQLNR